MRESLFSPRKNAHAQSQGVVNLTQKPVPGHHVQRSKSLELPNMVTKVHDCSVLCLKPSLWT